MSLRIFSLFAVLFISTNAHSIQDGDYVHVLESITGLQSTVASLQSTVINLEDAVCKLEQKVEHLAEKHLETKGLCFSFLTSSSTEHFFKVFY